MVKNPNIKKMFAPAEYSPENIQDLIRCSKDPRFFIENYVKVQHPIKGTVPMKLYDYQIRMLDAIHNHKDSILLCSRQLGKTTVAAMYILWLACFHEDKLCIIASKAMAHAVEIMSRVQFAYEELPMWLKPGCRYYSRTSIEFDNGSKIKSEATSEKTGRGSSPSIIFIDEIAFLKRRIQDELWASLAPALSTGGKFIITSTPNGDSDLFATLWREARSKINSFFPCKALYYEHPEREPNHVQENGLTYYEEMRGKLGPVKVRQELDCEFLSSDPLLIDSRRLHQLRPKEPITENMGFKFWKTIDPRCTYLVGVDPATGTGSDFTVIQVFEFPSLEQVAELRLNQVVVPLIYAKIKWLLKFLRTPDANRRRPEVLWSFERNGVGEALVAMIQSDETVDAPYSMEGVELFNDSPGKLGCFTGKSKLLTCMKLKNLMERMDNTITINSDDLLEELKNFVAKGGSYAAKPGATDDAVSATLIVMRLLDYLASYDERASGIVNREVAPDSDQNEPDSMGDDAMPIMFM